MFGRPNIVVSYDGRLSDKTATENFKHSNVNCDAILD